MYALLKKILPDSIKNKTWVLVIKLIQRKLKDQDARMPKYVLDDEHIKNIKVLANREKMLELLPKNAIVAELGVNKGDFSERILKTCQPLKLHLVDVWGSKRYHKGLMHLIEEKFASEIKSKTVEINLGLSTEVADQFPDKYFDWIYIDTEHSYHTTKAELDKYASKMKPGGIIAGHDFTIGNWNGLVRYGVIEAVYEFCVNQNWELLYLTANYNEFQSFAIKKIN